MTFDGDNFELVGSIGPDQGGMDVTIDDVPSSVKAFDCGSGMRKQNIRLSIGSNLGPGTHTLKIVNRPVGSRVRADLDYLLVRGVSLMSTSSTSSTSFVPTPTSRYVQLLGGKGQGRLNSSNSASLLRHRHLQHQSAPSQVESSLASSSWSAS